MRRAATSVVLSGWIGFLAVASAVGVQSVLFIAAPAVEPLFLDAAVRRTAALGLLQGNAGVLATAAVALAAAALATTFGMALWLVHWPERASRGLGAHLALGALGATSLLLAGLGAFGLMGLAQVSEPATAFGLAALSALAALFDGAMDVEAEADGDDAELAAAAALIGQGMVQNVLRHPAARQATEDRTP